MTVLVVEAGVELALGRVVPESLFPSSRPRPPHLTTLRHEQPSQGGFRLTAHSDCLDSAELLEVCRRKSDY